MVCPKTISPLFPCAQLSRAGETHGKDSLPLETILKQLLAFIPTHLSDTKNFMTRVADHCRSQPLSEDAIFFSIDAVNLYGSIPVEEAIEAAKQKLDEHRQDIETFGLSLEGICTLLEQCLKNNVFSFGDDYYRQKQGIAMGNHCAPPLAIIFLDRFEQQALMSAPLKPDFLARCIDDYAGIRSHAEEGLLGFLQHLNSLLPHMKFTLDHSQGDRGVPFWILWSLSPHPRREARNLTHSFTLNQPIRGLYCMRLQHTPRPLNTIW